MPTYQPVAGPPLAVTATPLPYEPPPGGFPSTSAGAPQWWTAGLVCLAGFCLGLVLLAAVIVVVVLRRRKRPTTGGDGHA
jgi:hypothetical protein